MSVRVLVPISGGKDSQACLKLATQNYALNEIRGLFCDTQFEHPITYGHVQRLREMYGPIRIDTVCGGSVLEKSRKYGRFPGGGSRHCTDELKIRETRIYCADLAREQRSGFEVWYGMRAGESHERAKRYAGKISDDLYFPHEVMSKYPKYLGRRLGVMFRLPVLDWTEQQILYLLGDELNPLYRAGFPRVGCFPCLASGDKWKEKAFTHDDVGRAHKASVDEVAVEIGKSIWTSKGGKARHGDDPGCAICQI